MLELKVATPQLILNYAAFLEEHHYFEEAFKAYERGVDIFKFPYSLDIWVTYLTKFVERYVCIVDINLHCSLSNICL